MSNQPTAAQATDAPKESVKETLISIVIAFALAFVFRGFVVEAFVIPTGSMAPTLMGAHMRFQSDATGYSWPVGPWHLRQGTSEAKAIQGQRGVDGPITVHDPMSGKRFDGVDIASRAGDRILVLKYLYGFREPERYDVVVFKNPGEPAVNYIKRLIGLPGEQIALVDGDVFVHKSDGRTTGFGPGGVEWDAPGWQIARKSDAVSKTVWQPVFDAEFTPPNANAGGVTWFQTPWVGQSAGWAVEGQRAYTYDGAGPTALAWDSNRDFIRDAKMGLKWEISDRYAYNECYDRLPRNFPVGDIRLRAGIEIPDLPVGRMGIRPSVAEGAVPSVSAIVTARGHEFRGMVTAGKASVAMRPQPTTDQPDPAWKELGQGETHGIRSGFVAQIEFWHIDQRLELLVDGKVAARGEYDWTPAERIAAATGQSLADLLSRKDQLGRVLPAGAQLSDPSIYKASGARWEFSGGPVVVHRAALDRDLHYRPDFRRSLQPGESQTGPAWATHPNTVMTLGPDHFFVLGDNSPASEDGRLWTGPDSWVASEIDPTIGVVPRELMLGKAFFVYFPALAGNSPIPMPDFGRLRFIW